MSNSPPAPPPAPPASGSRQAPTQPHASAARAAPALSSQHFTFEATPDGEKTVKFIDAAAQEPNAIPLKIVVRQLVPGSTPGRSTSLKGLYLSLGKLRSVQLTIRQSNELLSSGSLPDADLSPVEGWARYVRYHTMNLCSVLGVTVANPKEPIRVPGLDELIAAVEAAHADEVEGYRDGIRRGTVQLEGLAELYVPGTYVSGATSLGSGLRSCFYVRNCHFEERRSLFGIERVFKFQLEFVASFGRDFVVMAFEELLAGWTGTKMRALEDLPYQPISDTSPFRDRGQRYVSLTTGARRFVQYRPGGFFPHHSSKLRSSPGTSASGSSGRIVIDTERGAAEGHHASQGSDEPTNALIVTAGRYKRLANEAGSKPGGAGAAGSDAILTFTQLPESLHVLTWPAVVGFSFAAKSWGHALVDWLEPITFNDQAFDQLVLAAERKRLIRALVMFGDSKFEDIIAGKSGGSVFLLHGAPGTGKTLTAEAIAEVLHRPLYYVTMGELGVTPEEMERRLSAVLDLCAGWDALVLIDEADVFLEKRATSDVLRNAMVCVMLRLIEYHQGILFLTTNRVKNFDPAFESRVTVALKYDDLTADARAQVWSNLLSRIPKGAPGRLDIKVDGSVDLKKLSRHALNGRQIKNAVRLSLALVEEGGTGLLTHEVIEQTIGIMSIGREEMAGAAEY
ncbi:P-loop containing nucleoside triphosphate hydrolase protein [Gonapodya prolifera JEL478]|uniref:p-loop containing nucleoside triphosphate hydrolase protein n=1 Tax=Gonapodya prolifera (strain JEL478) TaxID=1344416 RepID=A0A139A229_GONPJ|nr:P-loop containing nucleoside triphosphate hydrolase protein [Gonapodya prolifera JEL478]|eukprot:KXS10846.1 P-loop containing nucleoside triphosphate hydrolase protein [Gonapodya prolifera JEL478]